MIKRSLLLNGHRTSVALEAPFWALLKADAETRGLSLNAYIADIDATRDTANLASALRLTALEIARALPPLGIQTPGRDQ